MGAWIKILAGEGAEGVGGFLIGNAGGGGAADEFGQGGGVMFGEVEDQVQRGAPGAASGVVEIAAPERDGAEEGVDADGAAAVNGLAGQRGGVVREGLAVVVEVFDDAAGIAGEGVAQARLEPIRQVRVLLFPDEFPARLGEEEFRFAVCFGEAVGLEVFFSATSGAAVSGEARRAMVCWMVSSASWPVSCWKRW